MKEKRVLLFTEDNSNMRDLLGSKGANLSEITNLGLPVPLGFTITTKTYTDYINNGNNIPKGLIDEIKAALKDIENKTGKIFGDSQRPLLVSVRSSKKNASEEMMDFIFDKLSSNSKKRINTPLYILKRLKNKYLCLPETILNLGLNDEIVECMVKTTQKPQFCYNIYRRFIAAYASVAYGMNKLKEFDMPFQKVKIAENVKDDTEISLSALKTLIQSYKNSIKEATGKSIPKNPYIQLEEVIKAIYNSYVSNDSDMSITIQQMVFGNADLYSATGVLFTRNPITGENKLCGEYLMNAQGEDIIYGSKSPSMINQLKLSLPQIYEQFINISKELETYYKKAIEIEFTIENGKVWILQTHISKLTADAKLQIAIDMVSKGLISKEGAILDMKPNTLNIAANNDNFNIFIGWLDEIKKINVGANIYHPEDILNALKYQADMIGLCRTEFLIGKSSSVLNSWFYNLVNAKNSYERYKAVAILKDKLYQDYYNMLKAFDNKPFTVRLSDSPLELFILESNYLFNNILLKKAYGKTDNNDEQIYEFIKKISDTNYIAGLRGSRLAILYPEFFQIQIEAFFEASCELKLQGYNPKPYIMTSFISETNEIKILKNLIEKFAEKVMEQKSTQVEYKIGTMIEIPRAALIADDIAQYADFFAFGTNDLTQMTFGYSRNDFSFLNKYLAENILPYNPFHRLDEKGVGQLIKLAIKKGKETKKDLSCTICGIQMREINSVKYALENNIDGISIDPEYIPQAKLLSAQHTLKNLNK